jgi:hypothetical protein
MQPVCWLICAAQSACLVQVIRRLPVGDSYQQSAGGAATDTVSTVSGAAVATPMGGMVSTPSEASLASQVGPTKHWQVTVSLMQSRAQISVSPREADST